jgi:hypothetical protein
MSYCPLDLVENYLRRFVAYPNEHALVAHTLWVTHTHLIECFDTSPRLAFMSAEKESGKTRALEVTALLVPEPIMSISASPAVIVRKIAQDRCTILYDEIDGVFGTMKAQEANLDLRSVLNGGYRRGAKVHRCATHGKKIEIEEFEAFAAVVVAGLRDLPDTLASRAIIIRMKRRAPAEQVEPFRHRYQAGEAEPIRDNLREWCEEHAAELMGAEPELPEGIKDRASDIWEPLVAVADVAGSDWPARARAAAVFFTKRSNDETLTRGVELLSHIRDAFGDDGKLHTKTLIDRLCERDESPWKDIRGKTLDDRGLASRLRPYGIKSKDIWIGGTTKKGYDAVDFHEDWARYLAPLDTMGDEGDEGEEIDNNDKNLADLADLADGMERDESDPFAADHDAKWGLQPRRRVAV